MTTEDSERLVIAARLREARETLGLTQGDVASAIGIQRTSMSVLESGKRGVSGLELRRLARLYRRPVGWLLGEDHPPIDGELVAATVRLSESDRQAMILFARFLAHQQWIRDD